MVDTIIKFAKSRGGMVALDDPEVAAALAECINRAHSPTHTMPVAADDAAEKPRRRRSKPEPTPEPEPDSKPEPEPEPEG
jgi:hypothetical protein